MILKIYIDTLNFKKSHMTLFYDVMKITSPKTCHQNDDKNFSIFKPFP